MIKAMEVWSPGFPDLVTNFGGEHVVAPEEVQYHSEVLGRVQEYIAKQLSDASLTPATIAAAHHVSVRSLQRLFERHNITVAGWIRDQRLARCRSDLADPQFGRTSVQTIAGRWGFTAASHFSRAFRAAYGLTPIEFRRHIAAGQRLGTNRQEVGADEQQIGPPPAQTFWVGATRRRQIGRES